MTEDHLLSFQAQSDDDDAEDVPVGMDTGGYMDEFFAQVCLLFPLYEFELW